MSIEPFDVVILGGGNAGIGVTGPVRRAGMSVAMIESHDLGGTCPNRGCTPKKVLVAAGHALHEIERAAVHHIAVGKPRLDWAALIDREKDLIKDIPANLARSMAHRNVEVIKGHAIFAGPNVIQIGERRLEAKHIVIATGSKPRPLPIPGAEHMITSEALWHHRKPDQGQRLRLPDVFFRHQAHAVTPAAHSAALSIQKPTGISLLRRFRPRLP